MKYIYGDRGGLATGDTGKISLGGRMDFSGGRFDTLPFPLPGTIIIFFVPRVMKRLIAENTICGRFTP